MVEGVVSTLDEQDSACEEGEASKTGVVLDAGVVGTFWVGCHSPLVDESTGRSTLLGWGLQREVLVMRSGSDLRGAARCVSCCVPR